MPFTIHGLPVSQGIAIGHAHLVSHALLEVNHYQIAPRHVEDEIHRFDEALENVRVELRELRSAPSTVASEIAAFVDLHLMLLDDPMLSQAARELIRERRCNAEWALVQQMNALVDLFEEMDDAYLRERKADVIQIVERILKELLGQPGYLPTRRKHAEDLGSIVVAHDLSPADTIHFKDSHVTGFVTDAGGATSHTAIVARSLSIPAVVGLLHVRELVQEDDILIIDGRRGVVIIDPDERVLEEYRLRKTQIELERSKLNRLKSTPAATLDGELISLQANIELPRDVSQAKGVEADGVGLFRTEFLFMNRDDLPDEDEQFEAYRTVAKAFGEKPVTIRTLDIGADKNLSTDAIRHALNPALGLRAIRYCLSEPQLFMTQLRAILRASYYGKIRIMLPMIAHVHEIDMALQMIESAKKSLKAQKIKYDEVIAVGGMIEVPAAALSLNVFLKRLQFLSIGTNDLIQYTLAIDRADESVAHLYDPLHPAVLKLIAQTIQAGAKARAPVSVCGEMAGNSLFTRLLIGMGLRQFSMHPSQVLEVKNAILHAEAQELTAKVNRLLKLDEPEKMREAIDRL